MNMPNFTQVFKMSPSISFLAVSVLLTVADLVPAQTSYNSQNQVCCNGTVHDKAGVARIGCCGQEAYDSDRFRCCGCGQPLDFQSINPLQGLSSCRIGQSAIYDHRKQMCCDGAVIDKPDSDVDYGCCNGQPFDKVQELCCSGRILEKPSGEQCCGNTTYDRKSQICCVEYGRDMDNIRRVVEYRITARESTMACCGLQTFDFRSHVCCDGNVVPKKDGMGEKRSFSCCDGEAFDQTKQFCCRITGKTKTNTYVYLESVLHDMDDGRQCCGALSYNYHEEVCCGNNSIPKPEGAPWEQRLACCDGQPMSSSNTQTCVRGKIMERKDSNFLMCGEDMYDRRTHLCCSQQAVNKQTHMCCGGKVHERGQNRKCCYSAGQAYDVTTHVCCSSEVQALTEEGLAANHDACCSPLYFT